MTIRQKIRRLEIEKQGRQRQQNNSHVSLWFLTGASLLIIAALLTGTVIGTYSNYLLALDGHSEARNQYVIDGYKITFLPEDHSDMEGNYGFTYNNQNKDIFINKRLLENRNFNQIKTTCEHELLHDLGVPSEHHDMIDLYEHQVKTPVCSMLVDKIK